MKLSPVILRRFILSILSASVVIPVVAQAQSGGAPTGSTGGVIAPAGPPSRSLDGPEADVQTADAGALGDIVVTARREQENLQRVPVTASAFDGDALRARSIGTPQDLTQAVSGIFLSGSGSSSNAQYSIRGASKPVAGAGAPGVVTYFADVPLPVYVSSTPQYDIASLQVLKGPQGTLFGRNTVGGALLIYPAAPGFDFDGYLQGTYGNFDSRSVEGAINIPLSDGVAAIRMAGRLDRADGFFRNLGAGGDLVNQHNDNARVSLLLKPAAWLSNTTILDYAETPNDKGHGAAQVPIGSGLPIPLFQALIAAQRARGPYVVDTGPLAQYNGWRNWGFTNRTDLDFGAVSVANIFGYRDVTDDSLTSFEGLPGPFFDSYQKVRYRQYSDELQIRGNAFAERLTWLLGGFYLETPPNLRANDIDLSFLGVPNGSLQYNFYKERSTAVFGNVSVKVTDAINLSAGARYTWDRYSSCGGNGEQDRPARRGAAACPAGLSSGSAVSGRSSAPTWTLGADWQVADPLFLYVTSRRGYKSGGLNSPVLGRGISAYQDFAPERTTDVELGAKSQFAVGTIHTRLNISAFRTWTDDKQLIGTQIATSTFQLAGLACIPPTFTPFIDGDCDVSNDPSATVLTINGGDTRTTGFEYDLTVQPVEGFTLTSTGTFLRQRTIRYDVPASLAAFFPAGGIPLLFTPKTTLTFGVAQQIPISDRAGQLSFNAQIYYSSGVNFYGYVAPNYTTLNARLDWQKLFGRPLDLGVFVRNALAERYVSGPALTSPSAIPTNSVLFGAPRTYGLSLRVRFGKSAS